MLSGLLMMQVPPINMLASTAAFCVSPMASNLPTEIGGNVVNIHDSVSQNSSDILHLNFICYLSSKRSTNTIIPQKRRLSETRSLDRKGLNAWTQPGEMWTLRIDLFTFSLPISQQVDTGGRWLICRTHNSHISAVPLVRVIFAVVLPVAC